MFFFNDTATTEIYTLSLHDALPIFALCGRARCGLLEVASRGPAVAPEDHVGVHVPLLSSKDRKSTRLNSSHANISYAVFCLKKKKHSSAITSSLSSFPNSILLVFQF